VTAKAFHPAKQASRQLAPALRGDQLLAALTGSAESALARVAAAQHSYSTEPSRQNMNSEIHIACSVTLVTVDTRAVTVSPVTSKY
jgi:hypothetical protein